MIQASKRELFERGQAHIATWCDRNGVELPTVKESDRARHVGTCAYYRSGVIYICVDACAALGRAGRQWSWPGYVVDRTPYGVLAHELGHHVERAHGPRGGIVASAWRQATGERPITSYAPNDNEWFAEMFRLYLTNPLLLLEMRPRVWQRLWARWPERIETREWRDVLAMAPRQLQAAENRIRSRR